MNILPFTKSDVDLVNRLQPEGWMPIRPYFEFYTSYSNCSALKVVIENKLVGIGASIQHQDSAWLAHIIVSAEYRSRGIGTAITKSLIAKLRKHSLKSILLNATPLGEAVYHKLGFTHEMDYVFMKEGELEGEVDSDLQPISFRPEFKSAIHALDYRVSGEDRRWLLSPHLSKALITLDQSEKPDGFYLPTLGEGLIISTSISHGIALLKRKKATYIALPEQNSEAIKFLQGKGFKDFRRGKRMWLGSPVKWNPEFLYCRVGGNLG